MGKIVFWVHKSKRNAHAGTVIGEVHKDLRALTHLASTAFALVHNSLMISAMHPDGAELYITIIVGWTDGENSAFWVQQEARVRPMPAQSLAKCIDPGALTRFGLDPCVCVGAQQPDDLGDASWWCGMYITHHCWVDRWGK
jgi:hypothetical protein